MDETLDGVPRPQAVIHAALTGLEADPDARVLGACATIFEALTGAAALAPQRWSDVFSAGSGHVRLLYDTDFPLPASILALAAKQAVETVAMARAFEDLLEDCDCLIVAGTNPAAAGGTDPRLRDALALDRPVLLGLPAGIEVPLLVSRLRDEFGLDAQNPIPTTSTPLSAESIAERVLAPPSRHRERENLIGFIEEGAPRVSSRVEYDLLMRFLGPPLRRSPAPAPDPWNSAHAIAGEAASWLSTLRTCYDIADGHALFYGERWRSALVTRSFLLLISIVVLGVIGMINEDLSIVTMPLQAVVAGFIFLDRRRAVSEQWERRWLEYRLLAERLRCLRFLHLAGVGDAEDASRLATSWPAWYSTRIARQLGPAAGPDPAQASAVLEHLLKAEIGEQISYHRGAIRRSTAIDARTRMMARVLLRLTVATGAIMLAASYRYPNLLSWSGIASFGLLAAPAIVTGLNAFRAEFDLVRLTERSSRIARGLMRLTHAASAQTGEAGAGGVTLALDRAVARRAASLMLDEVSQWRFVLEARAVRLKRH